MLRRRIGRPGLLGTMARTAVIAGTASATAGAVNRRQNARAMEQQEAAAYEQEQAAAYQPPPPAAPPVVAAESGIGDQLNRLATLHAAGELTDEEFAAAKRRLLG